MWCFKINNRVSRKNLAVLIVCFTASVGLFAKGNVDSETAKAYFEIAQAYTEVSKYDKAADFYLKAAKDPAHKNAAEYNLARVYGLQGEWTKAKLILERQYKEAPGNILILKAYSYSLAAIGDEARACAMYKKLYDEDSENPESALNYARILILAKRYDEATSLIEELKTRFTESTENKAIAELEEKIKKAQEEPEKEAQRKGEPNKDGKVQNKTDTADSTEGRMEKGASDSKSEQGAAKPAETGTVKNEDSQTKLSADSKKPSSTPAKPAAGTEASGVKVKDGKKT